VIKVCVFNKSNDASKFDIFKEFFEWINSKISLTCCTETGAVYQNVLDSGGGDFFVDTMGDFTFWLSLSLSQFAELRFSLSTYFSQKVEVISPSGNFGQSPKFPLNNDSWVPDRRSTNAQSLHRWRGPEVFVTVCPTITTSVASRQS